MSIYTHDTWQMESDKKNNIPWSRYLASFLNEELSRDQRVKLSAWLESLDLDQDDIKSIRYMAEGGKLELEEDYRRFCHKCKISYSISKPVK